MENSAALSRLVLGTARITVERILAPAGVRLRWSDGSNNGRQPEGVEQCSLVRTVVVLFVENPPEGLPTALAQAYPFAAEGVRIRVFSSRVLPLFPKQPGASGRVLGHVVAHEIVHVLQGIDVHSESDLMRSRWSPADLHRMAIRPFALSKEDALRIAVGMTSKPCGEAAATKPRGSK